MIRLPPTTPASLSCVTPTNVLLLDDDEGAVPTAACDDDDDDVVDNAIVVLDDGVVPSYPLTFKPCAPKNKSSILLPYGWYLCRK